MKLIILTILKCTVQWVREYTSPWPNSRTFSLPETEASYPSVLTPHSCLLSVPGNDSPAFFSVALPLLGLSRTQNQRVAFGIWFLRSACFQRPSAGHQGPALHSFSSQNEILLDLCSPFCLFILLSWTRVVSTVRLLWIMLPWMLLCKVLFEHPFSVLLGVYLITCFYNFLKKFLHPTPHNFT